MPGQPQPQGHNPKEDPATYQQASTSHGTHEPHPIHQEINRNFGTPASYARNWPHHQWSDTNSGIPDPAARAQDMALPTNGPALAPGLVSPTCDQHQSQDILESNSTH